MQIQTIIYWVLILAICSNLALGMLVITRNSKDSLNRYFFALTIAVGGWIGTNAAFRFVNEEHLKYEIALASYGFAAMLALCFYLFSIALVRHIYVENRRLARALVTSGTVMGCLSVMPGVVGKSVSGNTVVTNITFLALYGVALLLLLTRCIVVWLRARRRYRLQERNRMNVIILSFAMAAVIGVICNLLLPLRGIYAYVAIGPTGSLIFVAGTAYAIVKNRLFDVHFFVVRAAAYLTTLFGMTFVFIAPFIALVNYALGRTLNSGQFIGVVVLSVALIYLLQYLHRFFDRLTASIFYRDDYDPQDVQDKLGSVLVRSADLKVLRDNTSKILQAALKSSTLRYVLFSDVSAREAEFAKRISEHIAESGQGVIVTDEITAKGSSLAKLLSQENIALVIKLHTTHEDMGFMVLGHKQSGGLYSERDLRLLSTAADEIAIGLQNALRFEKIQKFSETLQEEVDIATRKLRRTNKRLEELDNIKDDFISMASHQLRTPLTSVKGYLSMVIEGDAGKLNATQEQMLKQAFASSQRMVFLITDLLNVSRLKTGKFVIDAAPTDLSEVVAQELEQLHETAQVKNIELSYQKPAKFPQLMLDEVKIRQVIMNFVDNAIYYTPVGGHIRVELTEKPNTVEFRVIDDGIGVPRSEQHHLFTKFYRATNARKTRPDGTGLGLFMAQKVIVAQGGTILFSSQENKGSTFGFVFSKSRLSVRAPQPEPALAGPKKAPK